MFFGCLTAIPNYTQAPLSFTGESSSRAAGIGVNFGEAALEVTRIFLHPLGPLHRIRQRRLEIFYKPNKQRLPKSAPRAASRFACRGKSER